MPFAPRDPEVRVIIHSVVQADVIERCVGHDKPHHLRISGASKRSSEKDRCGGS
jgi:hypothetical protein